MQQSLIIKLGEKHGSSLLSQNQNVIFFLIITLSLTACQAPQFGNGATEQSASYTWSCLAGATGVGALEWMRESMQLTKNGVVPKQQKSDAKKLAQAAVAGCAIGLAATAVGKALDNNQQKRLEEEMARDAKRRANEQQHFAQFEQEQQTKISQTSKAEERQKRSTELASARTQFEEKQKQTQSFDVGGGATVTVTQLDKPVTEIAQGCRQVAVSSNVPGKGQAKQYDTWCTNKNGEEVRVDSQAATA